MRFSAYTIKYPFITSMIALLEVIHETIKDADQNPEILSKIPTDFWKLVVNCFFELRCVVDIVKFAYFEWGQYLKAV